jgi:uncharacterized membrane protein
MANTLPPEAVAHPTRATYHSPDYLTRAQAEFHRTLPSTSPSVSGAYSDAWGALRRHFGRLCLLYVVALAILFGQHVLAYIIGGLQGTLLGYVYALLVAWPVEAGLLYACLRAIRGETPRLADLFIARRAYLSTVLTMLLYVTLVLLGCLLLFMPGLIVSARLLPAIFLVAEDRLGPIEALGESWRRTTGHTRKLMGVMLTAIPVHVGGLLLFVIGLVPASIWTTLACVAYYQAATSRAPRSKPAAA